MKDGQRLHVLQILEPGKDGVLRHVEGLSDFMLSKNVKVSLAYSDVRSSDGLTKLVDKIEKSGAKTRNLRTGNYPQIRDIRAYLRLLRLCRSERPDVLHAHSSKAGVLAKALRLAGIGTPIVYTPNAYFGMGRKSGALVSAFNGVERLLGHCGHTINVSADEALFARQTLKVPAKRQSVIYNAVDIRRYTIPTSEERARAKAGFGLPTDAIVLGCIARVSTQKNVELLYRAMAQLMLENENLWLFHLGEGNVAVDSPSPEVAKRIFRLNYLADTSSFYHAIDAFSMSSRYEGLSIAVIEAIASGCPLILTDVPGNREFLTLGLSHVWSSPGDDENKFCSALREWWTDRPAGRPCNHRSIAESRFGYEACYGAILRLYQKLSLPAAPR